jgi:hypothetical protein
MTKSWRSRLTGVLAVLATTAAPPDGPPPPGRQFRGACRRDGNPPTRFTKVGGNMKRLFMGTVLALAATATALVAFGAPASAADTIGIGSYAFNGQCAEPEWGGNGAPVLLRPCTNSSAQNWTRVSVDSGRYNLINQAYPEQCMDVRDGGDFNGAAVQIWSCTNTRGMQWSFTRVLFPFDNIRTRISDRCLDVAGVALFVSACNGATSQVWQIRQ